MDKRIWACLIVLGCAGGMSAITRAIMACAHSPTHATRPDGTPLATCVGADPCHACKTCSSCGYCAKRGGRSG
jgi:hypothetical protein